MLLPEAYLQSNVSNAADKQITREQAVLLRKERESAGDLPDLFCPV